MRQAPGLPILLLLVPGLALAQPATIRPDDPRQAAVDAIFSQYDRRDSPGCSVAVVKDGQVVLQKDYGMADISLGVARTSDTSHWLPYSEARVFVALAVAQLAREGKLGLDDPVRRYVPELPEYAAAVTVRQLLHHASGLADYGVLDVAFSPMTGRVSEDEFFRVLRRWGRLGFAPGAETMYSNTDYALLKILVERVSGGSLQDYAQARWFGPLGMASTRLGASQATRHPGHALFHEAPGNGSGRVLSYRSSPTGGIAVTTSLNDLVRWEAALRDPARGLGALLQSLEAGAPPLADGAAREEFSFGVYRRTYQGIPMVAHRGVGGYAYLVQRADRPLSVVTLCNSYPGMDRFGFEVAALFASSPGQAKPLATVDAPPPPGPVISIPDAELQAYAGKYRNGNRSFTADIRVVEGALEFKPQGGQPFDPLRPVGDGRFTNQFDGSTFLITFKPGADGMVMSAWDVTRNESGGDDLLRWTPATWPTADRVAAYAGTYVGEAVEGTLYVRVDGERVLVAGRGLAETTLEAIEAVDEFRGPDVYHTRFERDARGRVVALVLDATRVKGIRYVRSAADQ
ncbi:serine hydrolase domain-containing protein [Arenimonas metalli]|uniref:serine hydrolase domain-containing protein n=1 Tax=Arenimonas metalli TaxID=948077 RepID=UPI0009FC5B17|nr:serine hydrolase domain-containing protein [Arenimonas metalli]